MELRSIHIRHNHHGSSTSSLRAHSQKQLASAVHAKIDLPFSTTSRALSSPVDSYFETFVTNHTNTFIQTQDYEPEDHLSFSNVLYPNSTDNDLDLSNTTFYNSTRSDNEQDNIRMILLIIIPIMVICCALAFIVNLVIVFSAHWCKRPMTPTLYFSISLALADAFVSFLLAAGIVMNSWFPKVVGYSVAGNCILLTIEGLRVGGILATVSHLLALAVNHWIGIVRPLHYVATVTRRATWFVIIISWIFPISTLLLYFASIKDSGYASPGCTNKDFLQEKAFRSFIALLFFAPFLLMIIIYLHIFIIVKNHHRHPSRSQQPNQQFKKNVKAAVTTILILGTYVLGWMPAIMVYILICKDCIIYRKDVDTMTMLSVGIFVNMLVILKTLIDPIIYAARMQEIQTALRRMINTIFASCLPQSAQAERSPRSTRRGPNRSSRDLRQSTMYSNGGLRSSRGSAPSGSTRNTPRYSTTSFIHHPPGSTNTSTRSLQVTSQRPTTRHSYSMARNEGYIHGPPICTDPDSTQNVAHFVRQDLN